MRVRRVERERESEQLNGNPLPAREEEDRRRAEEAQIKLPPPPGCADYQKGTIRKGLPEAGRTGRKGGWKEVSGGSEREDQTEGGGGNISLCDKQGHLLQLQHSDPIS